VSRYARPIVDATRDSDVGMMQIGEVAERVGLSLRTVRYYEEMGLIEPETRTEGGFRLYTEAHVDRLALIKRMKPLGFTVQEMRELLDARDAVRERDDEQARERLSEFARAAAERCDELRAKLESGEELARTLRRESRRRPKPSATH
jgi:DNA-binding transcriptional MerR regulator